jgi:hypothetical protein
MDLGFHHLKCSLIFVGLYYGIGYTLHFSIINAELNASILLSRRGSQNRLEGSFGLRLQMSLAGFS